MVRFPLAGLEGVEASACSKVAAIVAACRLAAAANPSAADQKPTARGRRERWWRNGGVVECGGLDGRPHRFLARSKAVSTAVFRAMTALFPPTRYGHKQEFKIETMETHCFWIYDVQTAGS